MKTSMMLVVSLLAAACQACPPGPQPGPQPPPQPTPLVDASPAPGPAEDASARDVAVDAVKPAPAIDATPEAAPFPSDACGKACTVLRSLGCPEALPTPHGIDCHALCLSVENSDGLTLHPGSVAACTTLACVRKAGVACAK